MKNVDVYVLGKIKKKNFIKHVRFNEECNENIMNMINEYKNQIKEKKTIAYNPEFILNENEIFVLNEYQLNKIYFDAMILEIRPEKFLSEKDKEGVIGLCLVYRDIENKNNVYLAFQKWDKKSYSFSDKTMFEFENGTFNLIENTIFTISNKFDCLLEYIENELSILYFEDYKKANNILELNEYFTSILKNSIDNFVKHDFFDFEDIKYFKDLKDNAFQLKVSNILKNKKLVDKWESPENIQRIAKEHNIDIELKDGKIYLPKTKKAILEIIGILDEDYYKGAFTADIYKSNKKSKTRNENHTTFLVE